MDPVTGALVMTAVGTALKAGSSLAAGASARSSADYQAGQLEQNASGEIAAGQRRMFDKQLQTRDLISTSTARAAGSGVNAGEGSPVENTEQIARRGEYQSLLELWQGENAATGLMNEAKGVRATGEAKQKASYLEAAGTLASGAGQEYRMYGGLEDPDKYGRATPRVGRYG